MKRTTYPTTRCVRGYINLDGKTTEEYAMALLHIFNNVRESRELLKVYNNSGNGIYVVAQLDSAEALEDYLLNFADKVEIEEIDAIIFDADYIDNYEDYITELVIIE